MSALEPVILGEVNKVAAAINQGLSPSIGMAAQFPSTKPLLQIGTTEWLRSGVIAPRDTYPTVPDFLTLLGTTYGAPENGNFPTAFGVISVASVGAMIAIATGGNQVYISKGRGLTWTLASGVAAISVFEANGYIYASFSSSNLKRTLNGDSWETCVGTTSLLCGVAYGNGVYVAVPSGSDTICWVSTDGVNFTQKTMLSAPASRVGVCFVNGFFLAAPTGAVAGPVVSYDGSFWSPVTLVSGQTFTLAGVLAAGERALVFTTTGIFESADSVVWTRVGALPSGFSVNTAYPRCAYGDGLIIVFGTTSLIIANNPSSFVFVAFNGTAHSAVVSGEFLVAGTAASTGNMFRRKLNKFVGYPKFTNNTYYRVK